MPRTLPEIIADVRGWAAINGCTAFTIKTEDALVLMRAAETVIRHGLNTLPDHDDVWNNGAWDRNQIREH